jgi:transcriptional regulator with XRE-family HTH domain
MQFNKRLKEARLTNGLLQREVAEHLGIGTRAYRHWEAGDREPSIAHLIILANLLQVDMDWLLGRSED